LGFLGLFLILAWRIAGYYGADRYLLPLLGTPWTGSLAAKNAAASETALPTVDAEDHASSLPRTAPIR